MRLRKKHVLVWGMIFLYLLAGLFVAYLVREGRLQLEPRTIENVTAPLPVDENLKAAQLYTGTHIIREDGFVRLYAVPGNDTYPGEYQTNSEAVSYHLLTAVRSDDKQTFDWMLDFIQTHMIHPEGRYIMWRLEDDLLIESDGANIASDADIRAIKALVIAEQKWGDARYTQMIDDLAEALENVAITNDNYLAPYGGMSGNTSWTANEVWLSYADFEVFAELAKRRGEPWISILANTKQAYLDAQIRVGFYNPSLNEKREFGNGIDGGGYGVNSLWMMVRAAQSNDEQLMQSANKTLEFYKRRYATDAELFALYNGNGDPLSAYDTPWVYALVGRAATVLGDDEFATQMVEKLLERQIQDPTHELYGGIPESRDPIRIGQFTMHETILTLQTYELSQKNPIKLDRDVIEQLWQNRQPILPRQEPIDPEPEPITPTPTPQAVPTLTAEFLQNYNDNVAYYSFIYKEPKYLETMYFVRGDLVKIIAEERFFVVDTQSRHVSASNLVRETDRLVQDIRDDKDSTVSYIWYNLSTDDAHGCFVRQIGSYKLDPSYRETKENCITYANKPFKIIYRFIQFNDLPTLPHQWLEQYQDQEPMTVETGIIFRDVEQEAQHTAYVLTYQNNDGTRTKMTIQAQYKLPLKVEIIKEGRVIDTYEYDYFRTNDRQISVWHDDFLTI